MDFIMPDRTIDYEVNKLDAYPSLSDEMRAVVDYQAQNAKDAFVTDCSWDELRRKYVDERRFWNEGGPAAFKTVEMSVPGPVGEVPVRIYYPDDKPMHHAVIFIHGGGFTVGNNDTHDRMMRSIMGESGCAVIGVDYHLAPEYKFPIPLYESAAVARFFHEQGEAYGILPDKRSLCGDSGGANLSLGLNLYLRDTPGGNNFICALLLYYGSFGMNDSASMRLYGTALDGMRHADMEYYMSCYLEPGDEQNPYFATLNNDLTHGIPATYLCCGDLDPLMDNSVVLEQILRDHGVRTHLDILPGALHAFMHYGRMMEGTRQCFTNSCAFLKEELAAK